MLYSTTNIDNTTKHKSTNKNNEQKKRFWNILPIFPKYGIEYHIVSIFIFLFLLTCFVFLELVNESVGSPTFMITRKTARFSCLATPLTNENCKIVSTVLIVLYSTTN